MKSRIIKPPKVSRTFKLSHTPFTTMTCNKTFCTALHTDRGDLKCGRGVELLKEDLKWKQE
jgi:hypothetical protein